VTDNGDQLRKAFETHENLAPDPALVYARVKELARSYQRRRWGAQAAGGAVLTAGLIAGAIQLPGMLPGNNNSNASNAVVAPAAAASTAPPTQAELEKDWAAYFAAGYDYDDAVKLAKLWKSTAEIGTVKAEAGARLLAGETLPFPPSPEGVAAAKETARLDAFFAAGYSYNDAVKLAKLWKIKDPFQAKIEAGKKLLAGEKLPIKPGPADPGSDSGSGGINPKDQKRLDAYFNAGYDYNDAVKLAKLWKLADPFQAKVEAGKKLLAGQTLPIRP
jgi:hypothetical protein